MDDIHIGCNIKMKRKILHLFIAVFLVLALGNTAPSYAEYHERPIVVAFSKGADEPDIQLSLMMEISYVKWRLVLEELTAEDLVGASVLMLVSTDASLGYADAELTAINDWMNEGGKTIWVSGDSDSDMGQKRILTANEVLETIGSRLRIDDATAEDPISNGGEPYRVLGVSSEVDPSMKFLVRGVSRGLFHEPGIAVVYVDGEWIDLMEHDVEDVYVVMTTSYAGIVVDKSEPAPNVMIPGDEGNLPLMVIEVDKERNNLIIATGDAPFNHNTGLYMPEAVSPDLYGDDAYSQEGQILFENVLKFATVFSHEWFSLRSEIVRLDSEISEKEEIIDFLDSEMSKMEDLVLEYREEARSFEAQVKQAQRTANTMQIVAVAALVAGVVIGYLVSPKIKK